MKVRSPMHSIDVRGKFGTSLIFSIWRGLNYLKGLTIPVNPNTPRQSLVRGFFASASRAWAALSDAERSGWEAWAAAHPETDVFGNSFTVTGFNKFVGLSAVLLDLGVPVVETAPVVAAPAILAGVVFDWGETGEAGATFTAPGVLFNVEVLVAGPVVASRAVPKNSFRHHSYIAGTSTTVQVTGLNVLQRYGLQLKVVQLSDGQKSGGVSDNAIIAP